ncbi:GlxA family transcriptional regulator [Humibacter ginsenosidimutans]|uniref:Helix-turn-helix domain-containing protein n=1 Tax=Humibacter ginsenosidimutans TaxID=2599293 RepID=A0A5B8M1R6_9MICO|nr:helix-turn-helix domain-containing protein [Humibacter ginsenosidimutans]QDZ13775.1 helix-turn-helix domain-containing protein [Humibacter ginsenosidimutans]
MIDTTSHPHRTVAVLAFENMSPFHLSVPPLVFGAAGLASAAPLYDVVVCAESPGTLGTAAGFDIAVAVGLEAFASADIVVIPSWQRDLEPTDRLLDALRSSHGRGALIVGLCLGAYVLAASGLVDERELVTHWSAAKDLADRYPAVQVRSDVLWIDHGDVVTSAGVAAALDCCLHIARREHGSGAVDELARTLVLAPHRSGSQAQFIPHPVADATDHDPIELAMVWARSRLADTFGLDEWAASVPIARRTFTRRFRARTGASPQQWLLDQRIDLARLLLETEAISVERVAERAGFGSSASLRQHFRARIGVSPTEHRAAFRE